MLDWDAGEVQTQALPEEPSVGEGKDRKSCWHLPRSGDPQSVSEPWLGPVKKGDEDQLWEWVHYCGSGVLIKDAFVPSLHGVEPSAIL